MSDNETTLKFKTGSDDLKVSGAPFAIAGPARTKLAEAFEMAEWIHQDQFRKKNRDSDGNTVDPVGEYPNIRYLTHLAEVMALMIQAEPDDTQLIAGLLHDALEDQPCTPEGNPTEELILTTFGPTVVEYVRHCSDTVGKCVGRKKVDMPKEDWKIRKIRHVKHIDEAASTGDAGFLLVTLCDKISNAQAIVNDAHHEGDILWTRFNNGGDPRLTAWYYRMMLAVIQKHAGKMPKATALISRLEREVMELQTLAYGAAGRAGNVGPLELPATLEATLAEKLP